MKKTLIEQQPKEISEAQDFIMAQNPDIRVLIERDIRGIDTMTFPRFFQEVRTGVMFLQTLVQDNITRCLDDLKESEKMWDDAEEVASDELKSRDPFRKLAIKYKEAINTLFNSFAARNIENQFLTDLGERALDIISNFKTSELQKAQFDAFKEFYQQSMESRDTEMREMRQYAENLFKLSQESVRNAMPYGFPKQPQNEQITQPSQPRKKLPQVAMNFPTNIRQIKFPANLTKRSEKLKYLLQNYPGIPQNEAMDMCGVGRGTLSKVKKQIKDHEGEQEPQEVVQEEQEIPEGEMEERGENANNEEVADENDSGEEEL